MWRRAASALAVAGLVPTVALAAAQYRIEPIPVGDDVVPISASGVNRKGEVVGQALAKKGKAVAGYAYRGGVTTQVGLPGDEAVSINRRADVAGDAATNAAWWSKTGVLHNLGTKMSCQGSSHAVGMNDDRLLAGWISCWGGDAHAFVAQGGVVTDLPTLGGVGASARDVNNAGQVIGIAATDKNGQFGPHLHAFRWEGGVITDLGTLGGDESDATAIADNGHVIGHAQDASGNWLPYLHDGTQMMPLAPCRVDQYTAPRDINSKDQIVGIFGNGRKNEVFLMQRQHCHRLSDLLDASGADWELDMVDGINDAGQIVGSGQYQGETRVYIATPLTP
jgi:probable HAF family extracellular repeat protein